MPSLIRLTTLVPAMTMMAACGGGSTSSNNPVTLAEFDAFANEVSTAVDNLTAGRVEPLTTAEVIAVGSANYEGFASIVPNDTFYNILGRAEIDADFTNGGSLNGRITDLTQIVESEATTVTDQNTGQTSLDAPLVPVAGTLVLSNGNIQELAPSLEIDVDVSGDIMIPARTAASGTDTTFALDGALSALVTENNDFVSAGNVIGESDDEDVSFGFLIIGNPTN